MTAPTPTARGTPGGIKLKDGFSTKVTFSLNPTIALFEKNVTPPGLDGGDKIDQTTMHNVTYRTFAPRSLITMTDVTITCAWDPIMYTSIVAILNKEQTITVTYPDGSTLAFYGFLQKFEPSEFKEGDQPEASVTITPTNFDPVGHVEAGPALANVSGT